MVFLSKMFGKRSTSDNCRDKHSAKTKHYINVKGYTVPTYFKSKELQFDKYEFQKKCDYCQHAPTGHANIYSNYFEWIKKSESSGDRLSIDEINNFFRHVKHEIYRGIAIPRELSEEEICYLASWIAVSSCNSHGLNGYCAGKTFIDILTTECIYCLLFTMFFDEGANKAYLIDPEFVKGNDWIQRFEIPFILKEKLGIYVLLEKDLITISQKLREDEYCRFALWDAVNDQCFAVIRKRIVHIEMEDGYPTDVEGYEERFEPMEKSAEITERLNQCLQASEQTRSEARLSL